MKILKYLCLILAALVFAFFQFEEGEAQRPAYTIGFYNVENLFDTINDRHANDEDFLPSGKLKWGYERYNHKLQQLSNVIDKIGDEDGPEILGLCEVENEFVIQDLLKQSSLVDKNYAYIHEDSKDARGIDVALIYKKDIFTPINFHYYPIQYNEYENAKTRSILMVVGVFEGDSMVVFVNHWPSRRGGEEESAHKRMAASKRLKSLLDSVNSSNPSYKLIAMGDFNDEPVDSSIRKITGSKTTSVFQNPFEELGKNKEGSIKYKKDWELFDQILISDNLFKSKNHSYLKNSATIYHPEWMHYKSIVTNGPYRTFSGTKYHGGFSDHFPVYIQLKK